MFNSSSVTYLNFQYNLVYANSEEFWLSHFKNKKTLITISNNCCAKKVHTKVTAQRFLDVTK